MSVSIIGIDLAATFKQKKVGVAVVDYRDDRSVLSAVGLLKSTEEILSFIDPISSPVLLAIDCPLKLPMNFSPLESLVHKTESEWPMLYTYRPWEFLIFQTLKQTYGVSGRPFSSLTITFRGQILRKLLERRGWKLTSDPRKMADRCFTEVFPNLTLGILKEQRREVVASILEGRYSRITLSNKTGEAVESLIKNDDVADAVICAWTGALFVHSQTQPRSVMRLGDDKFGFVICPYTEALESHLTHKPDHLSHSHKVY